MRRSRTFVLICVGLCALWSCKKDRSFESGAGVDVPLTQQWQFSEGGTNFGGPMDTAFIRSIGVANSLSLSGVTTDRTGDISLQIISTGTIAVGAYSNPQVLFQYLVNGTSVFQNAPEQTGQFTINITSVSSTSVSGTFSGTVVDASSGNRTIADGKFTAPLSVATDVPEGSGRLTVWSRQLCDGSGPITVRVGDTSALITQAMNSEPGCGADGTATFTLPAGAYSVTAYCGTDSVVLDATVLPNVCSTLLVDIQGDPSADYFPLERVWTYGNNSAFDTDTMSITSIADTTIGGSTYRIFYNQATDEQHYYRKAGGNYYEYITRAFNTDLTAPAELIFLKDNLATGDTWDNDIYSVDLGSSGIPRVVSVLVRERITNSNFSRKFGGKTYNHMIEVTTEMYTVNFDGSLGAPISSFITDYAKGVGVVFYSDLNNGIDWVLRNFDVRF